MKGKIRNGSVSNLRTLMNVAVGDIIVMKKNHPCGNNEFDVLRIGMDFKIRCRKCGHEVMVPRAKAEKNIKKIVKGQGEDNA